MRICLYLIVSVLLLAAPSLALAENAASAQTVIVIEVQTQEDASELLIAEDMEEAELLLQVLVELEEEVLSVTEVTLDLQSAQGGMTGFGLQSAQGGMTGFGLQSAQGGMSGFSRK